MTDEEINRINKIGTLIIIGGILFSIILLTVLVKFNIIKL